MLTDYLRQFIAEPPRNVRHFYNAHFPGLYSIVLEKDGDCLARIFCAKPGELHPDLQTESGKFLWHSHGYDFTERALLGSITNICVEADPNTFDWYAYRINAGIDTGNPPTLELTGRIGMREVTRYTLGPGQCFDLEHSIIHRVVFKPCATTGWFACLVREWKKVPAPNTVFSPVPLDGVPDADVLYREISSRQAQDVVICLMGAMLSLDPELTVSH